MCVCVCVCGGVRLCVYKNILWGNGMCNRRNASILTMFIITYIAYESFQINDKFNTLPELLDIIQEELHDFL